MINQIHIKNFKSIVDLSLDLGRVNLFIGENGSGKSNILEAIGFASVINDAGIDNTVHDNTTLVSKGVRASNSKLFGNAFGDDVKNIDIDLVVDSRQFKLTYEYYNVDFDEIAEEGWREITMKENYLGLSQLLGKYSSYVELGNPYLLSASVRSFNDAIKIKNETPAETQKQIVEEMKSFDDYFSHRTATYLTKYIIYSPENSFLRKFEEEGQVSPLGARGEGLFSLLKSMSKDNGSLQHVKEYLEAIDWFEDFSIPTDLMSNEYKIGIKDRFISSDLVQLDQRSANEGFLFLLFYIVLFSSKKTPHFFAIDNIEASFNPKLCAKLINMLTGLAKKNDKQVLMTTHNPATLDGLDLNDPEQRLFVVRRNIDGHTIATRIAEKPKVSTPMKLSEMWTKGLLGGLPDNF